MAEKKKQEKLKSAEKRDRNESPDEQVLGDINNLLGSDLSQYSSTDPTPINNNPNAKPTSPLNPDSNTDPDLQKQLLEDEDMRMALELQQQFYDEQSNRHSLVGDGDNGEQLGGQDLSDFNHLNQLINDGNSDILNLNNGSNIPVGGVDGLGSQNSVNGSLNQNQNQNQNQYDNLNLNLNLPVNPNPILNNNSDLSNNQSDQNSNRRSDGNLSNQNKNGKNKDNKKDKSNYCDLNK